MGAATAKLMLQLLHLLLGGRLRVLQLAPRPVNLLFCLLAELAPLGSGDRRWAKRVVQRLIVDPVAMSVRLIHAADFVLLPVPVVVAVGGRIGRDGDITVDSVIAPRALRIGVVRVRLVVEGVWYVVRRLDHTCRQLREIAVCIVHRLEGKNDFALHCLHLLGGDGDQLQEIPRLVVIVLIKVPDRKH